MFKMINRQPVPSHKKRPSGSGYRPISPASRFSHSSPPDAAGKSTSRREWLAWFLPAIAPGKLEFKGTLRGAPRAGFTWCGTYPMAQLEGVLPTRLFFFLFLFSFFAKGRWDGQTSLLWFTCMRYWYQYQRIVPLRCPRGCVFLGCYR